MSPKSELQKQLNQLYNNCIVYREGLISIAKVNNMILNHAEFILIVKPENFLLRSKYPSKKRERLDKNIQKRMKKGWGFGCIWEALRYENGWFYGYGGWGFCCEPKFVSKIITLVEQERVEEAMSLIP